MTTVYEAQQITVYMKEFGDKLERLNEKVDRFIEDNNNAHDIIKDSMMDIKERATKIESDTGHMKDDINATQEHLKLINGKTEEIPALVQWKEDFKKRCADVQAGHKKKHEEIVKIVQDNKKDNEQMHDKMDDKFWKVVAILSPIVTTGIIKIFNL